MLNPIMAETFDLLSARLKQVCGSKPVYYVPNPGNWGDALIRYGTLKFFREAGIEVAEKTLRKRKWVIPKLRGGTVVYGGGGGWNDYWNLSRLVEPFTKRFQVIVLPSSYSGNYAFERTMFFRRDEWESRESMPDSSFCHDMAFYIGDEFCGGNGGGGVGYFFRRDVESAGWRSIPSCNRDLSLEGHHMSDVAPFFEVVNHYAAIHTDRLHVAIAACLLGKVVHLYANAYFKNRAVYESSLKRAFGHVHFHDYSEDHADLGQVGAR